MKATPWPVHEPTVPEVIRLDKPEFVAPRKERAAAVGHLCIKQEYLDAHGYTQHGPKRQSIIVIHGNKAKSMVPHSEQCRARITAEIAQTEGGQEKLQKVFDKSDRYYAEKARKARAGPVNCRGGEC